MYDEVYSKGKEILAIVDHCEYCNEDIISVYSFTHYNLIVTRNRFLLIAVDHRDYSVKWNIRFEDCLTMNERHKEDGRVELVVTCLQSTGLFESSNFSAGNPFGLHFVEKRISIGKGHSASRVADMLKEIIETEMAHHNTCIV